MTLTNTKRSITHTGNGATTVWSYDFIIPDDNSHEVSLLEIATGVATVLTSSAYTIAGLNVAAGGTVTYPKSGTPLAATHKIIITRKVPRTQTVTITNQTRYFAGVVMGVWDRLTMMMQEVGNDAERSLRTAVDDGEIEVLPRTAARQNKFLAFDSNGDPIAADGAADSPVSPAMAPVIAATTLAGGRTELQVSNLVEEKTVDYTAVAADRSKLLHCTAGLTLTMTAAATLGSGWFIDVKADGGTVVLDPVGGGTYNLTDGQSCRVHCDGTEFFVQFVNSTSLVDETNPKLGGQLDVNGNALGDGTRELLTFTEDASAVNHVNIENEATGNGPIIAAKGDDTNVDLHVQPKGTGRVKLLQPNLVLGSDADGDLYYRNGGNLVRLPKGAAGQVLKMNSGGALPEWGALGGWRQIGTNEPTSDVTEVAFTGISGNGYRSLRLHGLLQFDPAGAASIQVRASAGTWRTVGQTVTPASGSDVVWFDFIISNLDGAGATNLVFCKGTSGTELGVMDRSNNSTVVAPSSGGNVSFGYSSFSETIDEVRITGATFEGSNADQRGIVLLEAI